MIVGITGADGFIGEAVWKELLSQGQRLVSLDEFVRGNCSSDVLKLEKLDWVLHFGAKTSIDGSFDNPFETFKNNLDSTLKALEIAKQYGSNILYLSSYVYGPPEYVPVDENHKVNVTNPYLGSKYLGELISQQISELYNIRLTILRAFHIYGIAHKPGRLISDLIEAFLNGEPFLLNDPKPCRDYLYIKDFVSLVLKIVQCDEIVEGTFNVGYGQSHSNMEVVNIFNQLTGNMNKVIVTNKERANEVQNCLADISKVRERFSWQPKYTISNGLREMVIKMQAQQGGLQ